MGKSGRAYLETLDPTTRASIVFARLKDLPPEGRARLLEIECGPDAALRAEIEALLEASDRGLVAQARSPTPEALPEASATSRPDPREARPPARLEAPITLDPPPALGPGALVAGRYRLVRKVGSGGLSVVFLARQESPVQREVALKLLAPGIHTESVLARFEGERNALSRMNHHYVAQIHDAGTTEHGQAFVAMEYIDGLPIDVHCKQHGLDPIARLELFLKVCRAVAHAHQKGIIHRDLKPTNILVLTSDEGEAVPKVIDFGIAKSVTGSLTSGGVNATRVGFVVGTPGYMSPEQASAGDVDTATDVYALGVILYELMTGTMPLAPPDPAHIDMQAWYTKLVTLRPEPMSQRIRSFGLGERDVARTLGPTGPLDARTLLADLDTIALKALAPDVEARYRTVSELAGDIERALAGEPIVARSPGLADLIRRALRRRRASVIAALAGLALIVTAGVVIANLTRAGRAAREEATQALARARAEERLAAERVAAADETRARGQIAAAQAAVQVHNAAAARRNLDAVPKRLRAWEWRWLAYVTDQSELVLHAHRGSVSALALSEDEEVLASLGESGLLCLWGTTDGAQLQGLQTSTVGRSDKEHGLALALERGLAVTSDNATHMCGWDLVAQRVAWCREGVFGLSEHSVGARGALAVGTPVGVELVALETGETLERVKAPSGTAFAIWAEPRDPGSIIAWGHDATVALARDAADATWRVVWRRRGSVDRSFPTRGLLSLQRWREPGERDIVDVATGGRLAMLASRSPIFGALEIDPLGGVATVEHGSAVSLRADLWAPPDGELLGHRAAITAGASGRSGFWLGDAAGEIRRWSTDIVSAPARVARSNDAVFAGALAPGGARAFTSGWGMVKAWAVGTGAELWSRWLGRDYLMALAAESDEIVVGSDGGDVTWLDASDGRVRARWSIGREAVTALAVTGDVTVAGTVNGRLAGYDRGGAGVLWSATTHAATIGPVAVHPDGRWVAVGGGRGALLPRRLGVTWPDRRDGAVLLVEAETGAVARSMPVGDVDGWLALSFSPDGTRLAGGAADGTFTLWTLNRPDLGVPADRLPSLGLEVRGLVFSQDGDRLFVGDEHGTIQIWSVKALDHLTTLPGVGSVIVSLAIAPGSDALVAMSERFPMSTFNPWAEHERALGQAAWRAQTRLRATLDALFEREGGSAAVIATIEADPAYAQERGALVRAARARGDNPNELNSWAWGMLRYPDVPAERVARARRIAEICADGWPRWEFENTRALARLRDGDLPAAIASAERSRALGAERGVHDLPTEWAVIAMARARLGEREAARVALDEAARALERPPWVGDGEARSIVDEARRALE